MLIGKQSSGTPNCCGWECKLIQPLRKTAENACLNQNLCMNVWVLRCAHSVVSNSATAWTVACQAPLSMGILQARVGCHALLQRIFPTQGWTPGLPLCRLILYHLSHQGSPRTLQWVACPFSRRSSQPRNQTRVSCIADSFFTNWAMREVLNRDIINLFSHCNFSVMYL